MNPASRQVGELPETGHIAAILTATGRTRQHLLDDFMRAKLKVFRSVAMKLCRTNSMDLNRHLDEATSIVGAECVVMMNEIIADPTRLQQITSFNGKLWLRCRPVFRSYCDSASGGVNASGAVALARRMREMGRMREALRATFDREPTNEEIVEATNTKMRATRKDPARQSMICSVDDLRTDPVAYSLVGDVTNDPSNDSLLASHEAAKTITSVIRLAEQTSPTLGLVARVWIGDLYNPAVQAIRTPAQIAEILQITPATVSRRLAHLRVVARSYLSEVLAITENIYQGDENAPAVVLPTDMRARCGTLPHIYGA